MKKILMTLACSVGLIWASSTEDLDRKYGFREISFETKLDKVRGLSLVADSGDYKVYRRASDSLRLGTVPLSSIEYVFYKGEFIAAHILCIKGPEREKPVLELLKHAYGDPSFTSSFTSNWRGKRVVIYVLHSPKSENIIVHMRSRKMDEKIEKEMAIKEIQKSGL